MFDYENYNSGFNNDFVKQPSQEWMGGPNWVAPTAPENYGKKKNGGGKHTALLMIACIGVSSVFGFAGGFVSSQVSQGQAVAVSQPETQPSGTVPAGSIASTPTNLSATGNYKSVADVATAVKGSVVEITTEVMQTAGRMGQFVSEGAGSGVIVSSDGYIATNNHVIDGASSIAVRLADGTEYSAKLVGTDAQTDLAVIKIDAAGLTPVTLGNSSALTVGESTVAVGNPLGELGGTVTTGILSALDREINIDGSSLTLLQTDAAINPGNSGGGLFNMDGELIGIVNAKSSGTGIEGLGFAIPVDTVKTVINDIIDNGYVRGRIDAGLSLVDIQDMRTAMMYRVDETGLYIAQSHDSALSPGDRITAVGDVAVSDLADFKAAMNDYQVGDSMPITVVRDGRNVTVEIVLGEQKA